MRPDDDLEERDGKTRRYARDGAGGLRAVAFWDGGTATVPLGERSQVVVGRSAECDVHLRHPSVSRRHVILHLDRLSVEDLGSANGTWVRGAQVAPGATVDLAPGDVIEVGKAMLIVQAGDEPASPRIEAPASGPTVPPPPRSSPGAGGGIVVRDAAMERVHRLIDLVAPGAISVLLLGETGVGKEVAAETLHRRSPRAQRPFFVRNCAALPETLLESELFGHEKGAFTGAATARPGLLEAASGGTVFLDEVGELPLTTQAKLLRVVESREVTRVGGLTPRPIDVRFVSATNRDLLELSRDGRFREDLFYRLGGVTITIPPLRDRPGEIEPLARMFLERAAAQLGRVPPALSPGALAWLAGHRFPGNVRELRNVIERAVLLCTGPAIDAEHLPPREPVVAAPAPRPLDRVAPTSGLGGGAPEKLQQEMAAFERGRIAEALDACAGNQTQAAKLLGISRRTLIERLDQYGLPRPRKPGAR